ncbi:stomatal cytokinesis defective SCD1 protein, partial [Trifolium pratense]
PSLRGSELRATLKGHTRTVRAISSDRGKVVSGSDDQSVLVWDKQTTQLLEELKGHDGPNWISLKHQDDVKLFKMFADSIKDFKERYYIIRPESPSARENLLEPRPDLDEHGVARRDSNGEVLTRMAPKFPLSWSYSHFDKGPKEFTTRHADLSAEDKAAFESLKAYVAGFTPSIWTTRKGETIRDEEGNPREIRGNPRFINTRKLLECRNPGEVKICLDEMESIADRMLKAKQNERSSRPRKKTAVKDSQHVRPGTPSVQVEKQKTRIIHLKNEVDDYNEKKKRWSEQVTELRLREQDLAAARQEIDRLTAAMAPGKDEHKAAEGLTTRAELVDAIARLSHDFVEGTEYAFANAVQQIKLLNPEVNLVTDGMHVNGSIEDGRIVVPADLAVSDDEEDDAEENEVEQGDVTEQNEDGEE